MWARYRSRTRRAGQRRHDHCFPCKLKGGESGQEKRGKLKERRDLLGSTGPCRIAESLKGDRRREREKEGREIFSAH